MNYSHQRILWLVAALAVLPLLSFGPFPFFLPIGQKVGFNMLPRDGECKPYVQEEFNDLRKISVFPKRNVLKTNLVVRMRERCVPVWGGLNSVPPRSQWVNEKVTLQTYGYQRNPWRPIDPDNPDDPNIVWSSPGPLFYLKKASSPFRRDGSRFQMVLYNRLPLNQEGPGECDSYDPNSTYPNCFHGDQTTNFHFHGFHVSPQPHQDDVLVRIVPQGTPSNGKSNQAIGQYRFNLDPLQWNQAEGTHWYHAHKHGSTSLQLANGLAGMFIIQGAFDQWLKTVYGPFNLQEKPIVIQQIQQFLWPDQPIPPQMRFTLVNGQANPIITMRPGEIQRWRFLNATMQASAQVRLTFEGLEAKQIAMDGVPFAPENYQRQPLFIDGSFEIASGNRADFLVKAPRKKGRYYLTVEVVGELGAGRKAQVELRDREIINSITNYPYNHPPLLTMDVAGFPKPMKFPVSLPPLPSYLEDIPTPEKKRTIVYSMKPTSPGPPNNEFLINDTKFDPSCSNQTVQVNTTEQWQVENDSTVGHPFHIHTNPFQVIRNGLQQFDPPYIWQDTIALPLVSDAGNGSVVLNQRFEDFTGGYVQHCHILGHEDRGMMHGVQAVCPNGQYGVATAGRAPECRPGNYTPALPTCETVP